VKIWLLKIFKNLISTALFIFNITFLASQQKEKKKEKKGGLPISRKQNTKGGRAASKNKTPTRECITFFRNNPRVNKKSG
jgi:hypothetical protein